MKRLARILLVVLLNIVVLAALLEVGGLVFFLFEHGQLFYARERPKPDTSPETNPFMSGSVHAAIHPYFGFTYKINRGQERGLSHVRANNHGFLFNARSAAEHPGCCDYPTVRSGPDELLVGIFGGSVAGALAYELQENRALADSLGAIPRFRGRRIRILPFALGGHKQPQQLMILTYYLSLGQPLDVIVNVDGFNELLSGAGLLQSGIDVGYPDATTWMALVTFLERQAQPAHRPEGLLANYHGIMQRRWAARAARCRITTCYSLARLVQYWHARHATEPATAARAATEPPFFFQVNRTAALTDGMFETVGGRVMPTRGVYDVVADHWVRASSVMQQLARSQHMIYLHALQPNPWLRRSTPYVPRRPDQTSAYLKQTIPIAYPALLARAPRLRELGVNFVDLSAAFDNEPSDVYSDDVGHFTPRGYDLLALGIFKALAAPDLR